MNRGYLFSDNSRRKDDSSVISTLRSTRRSNARAKRSSVGNSADSELINIHDYLNSSNIFAVKNALIYLRKLVSKEHAPQIQLVIDSGFLPRIVELCCSDASIYAMNLQLFSANSNFNATQNTGQPTDNPQNTNTIEDNRNQLDNDDHEIPYEEYCSMTGSNSCSEVTKGQLKNVSLPIILDAISQSRLEAAWVVTNIASGSTSQTQSLIDLGCIKVLVRILSEDNFELVDQCIWALGNISGDVEFIRDLIIEQECATKIIGLIQKTCTVSREIVFADTHYKETSGVIRLTEDDLVILPQSTIRSKNTNYSNKGFIKQGNSAENNDQATNSNFDSQGISLFQNSENDINETDFLEIDWQDLCDCSKDTVYHLQINPKYTQLTANSIWLLSNLTRGTNPPPSSDQLTLCYNAAKNFIYSENINIASDALWAIAYAIDNSEICEQFVKSTGLFFVLCSIRDAVMSFETRSNTVESDHDDELGEQDDDSSEPMHIDGKLNPNYMKNRKGMADPKNKPHYTLDTTIPSFGSKDGYDLLSALLRICGNIATGTDDQVFRMIARSKAIKSDFLGDLVKIYQYRGGKIRKEIMWTISNITGTSNRALGMFVFRKTADIISHGLKQTDMSIRTEAIWVCMNISSLLSEEDVREFFEHNIEMIGIYMRSQSLNTEMVRCCLKIIRRFLEYDPENHIPICEQEWVFDSVEVIANSRNEQVDSIAANILADFRRV